MSNRTYPDGIDCVWIASDRNGNLGAFVTGGVGPIPVLVLNSEWATVENVEEVVCQLPKVSEVRLLVSMKRPDDFIAMAERGFFVYDWRDVHRTARESTYTYELIAVPLNPIGSNKLPMPLAGLVTEVRLDEVVFTEAASLDVSVQIECCNPEPR